MQTELNAFPNNSIDALGLPQYEANKALLSGLEKLQKYNLTSLFAGDSNRVATYSLEAAGVYLDYSKNLIDNDIFEQLISLAEQSKLANAITDLFHGEHVNCVEDKPALHVALRSIAEDDRVVPQTVCQQANHILDEVYRFADCIRSKQVNGFTGQAINNIVVCGIGGSYLGPKLVCEALKDYSDFNGAIHFVASLDETELLDVLEASHPEKTLFIVSSKSFETPETLENANAAKKWLIAHGCPDTLLSNQFVALTADKTKARKFGIKGHHIFSVPDWVGGRYSLWSAIGLPILIAIGKANFKALLAGARAMDKHFYTAPFRKNMPVILALLGIWYRNYLNAETHVISAYSYRLRNLAEYLQQLDMESNGKRVTSQGVPVNYNTSPIIWGGMGNCGQHAYYQMLHQGKNLIPVDFIVPIQSTKTYHDFTATHHRQLVANSIAQAQALLEGHQASSVKSVLQSQGYSLNEIRKILPHGIIPGNRPSNSLLIKRVTPETLGALLALYEHKTFCQGVIWAVNSFDQWGVKLGKTLSGQIQSSMFGKMIDDVDESTRSLVLKYRKECG